ncbi:MAG: hypothetical protein JW828_11585 [Sedimentisphaerales bacterium]|nr:hypothetical protein [Sedimentisphaerales bacterium]
MLDILRDFEQAALHFSPQVLVLGGIGLVVLGLCIWLGGLRWARLFAGLIGASLGFLVAYFFTAGQTIALVLMTVIGAGFGMFFFRTLLILVGGIIVVILVGVMFIVPTLQERGWTWPHEQQSTPEAPLGNWQTLQLLERQTQYAQDQIGQAAREMNVTGIALAVGAGILIAIIGAFFPRLIGALSCSLLGTSLIFLGMVSLLLYKGARPLTSMYENGRFYGLVLGGMIVFGTILSLVLSPGRKDHTKDKSQEGD